MSHYGQLYCAVDKAKALLDIAKTHRDCIKEHIKNCLHIDLQKELEDVEKKILVATSNYEDAVKDLKDLSREMFP